MDKTVERIYKVNNKNEFNDLMSVMTQRETNWLSDSKPHGFTPSINFPYYIFEHNDRDWVDRRHLTYSQEIHGEYACPVIDIEKQAPYQKGDKVEIINAHIFSSDLGVGHIGVVTDNNSYGLTMQFGDFEQICGHHHYKKYLKSANKEGSSPVTFEDNKTTLTINGKKYTAVCDPADTFDREKGVLLCIAKANGYTYDDIQNMCAIDQVREVRRKARVGEYIKLTKKSFTFNEVGDILKVSSVDNNLVKVLAKDHPRDTDGADYEEDWSYTTDEYVVLERYQPPKITIDEFFTGRPKAIHCDTNEKAEKLLRAFDEKGYRWRDHDRYTADTYWSVYKENTIYDNTNGYCDLCGIWSRNNNPIIYKFKEVDLTK